MAAATAKLAFEERSIPHREMIVKLSALTSDQTEVLTHGGPAMVPDRVEFRFTKAPTSLCSLTGFWLKASDTTTTTSVKIVAEDGGDPAGAEVDVVITFYACKAGGIG